MKKYFIIIGSILLTGTIGLLLAQYLPYFNTVEQRAEVFFKKGITYYNNYQYAAARENFLQALEKKSDFDLARLYLSNSYYSSGYWEESLSELEILASQNKLDTVTLNRFESLQILLGGGTHDEDRIYYNTIIGDDFRRFRFRNPTDIDIDDKGFIYIASFDTKNIVKFDPEGNPVANFNGKLGNFLSSPLNLRVYNNKLYVTDFKSDQIFEFDTNGNFINKFGKTGKKSGEFYGPSGIAINEEQIFISDSGNKRIQVFNHSGKYLFEITNTNLSTPGGLCFYKDQLYVLDKSQKKILVFDIEGNLIQEFNNGHFLSPRNLRIHENSFFITDEKTGLWEYNISSYMWKTFENFVDKNQTTKNFQKPSGVAFDYSNSLFVVDYNTHSLDIFSPKNQLTSNLNLFIEKIDTSNFPSLNVFLRLKDRAGRAIKGLPRSSFSVSENDGEKALLGIADMKNYNESLYLSLIFENTQDVKDSYPVIAQMLSPIFEKLTNQDKVEVVQCGEDSIIAYSFGYSVKKIFQTIREATPEENCQIGKSLYSSTTDLIDQIGSKAIILVLSGNENKTFFKQYSLPTNIRYAKTHSIPIYTIYLNQENTMKDDLSQLSEETSGEIMHVTDYDSINSLYKKFKSKKDDRYILTYTSGLDSNLKNFFVKVEISVNFRSSLGKDRGGYYVP